MRSARARKSARVSTSRGLHPIFSDVAVPNVILRFAVNCVLDSEYLDDELREERCIRRAARATANRMWEREL